MIQYINIQQFPGLDDGTCYHNIIGAGGWISAGMVVDNDQSWGISPNGRLEDLPHVYLRRIDRTFIDLDNIQYPVSRIEQDYAQMFLLQRRHLVCHQCGRIRGAVDRRAFIRGFQAQAAPQLNCGFYLRGLGFSNPVLVA